MDPARAGIWGAFEAPIVQSVHELGGIYILNRFHDWERVLWIFDRLPIELTAIRLVILLTDRLRADRGFDRQPEQRLGHLVGVRAVGLLDRLGQELHADVALDRPRRRVFVL